MVTVSDIEKIQEILDTHKENGLTEIIVIQSCIQKEGQGVLVLSPHDYEVWKGKNNSVENES